MKDHFYFPVLAARKLKTKCMAHISMVYRNVLFLFAPFIWLNLIFHTVPRFFHYLKANKSNDWIVFFSLNDSGNNLTQVNNFNNILFLVRVGRFWVLNLVLPLHMQLILGKSLDIIIPLFLQRLERKCTMLERDHKRLWMKNIKLYINSHDYTYCAIKKHAR